MTARLAIVGCGRVVTEAYAAALRDLDDLQPTIVIDLDQRRAAQVAQLVRHGRESITIRTDFTILKPEDVDLVILALPPAPAVQAARIILSQGCSVLAEKPFTANPAVLDEMEHRARSAGAWFGVVTNYLHRPDLKLATSAVRDGAIGQPTWVRLHTPDTGHWRGTQDYDPDWRIRPEALASGVASDKGFHLLYLAESLACAPIRDCQWRALGPQDGHVHTWSAQTGHENGVLSLLLATWDTHGHANGLLEVHGTEGSLYIDPTMRSPIRLASKNGNHHSLEFDNGDPWGYRAQFRDAIRQTSGGCSPELSGPRRWATLLAAIGDDPLLSFGTTVLREQRGEP